MNTTTWKGCYTETAKTISLCSAKTSGICLGTWGPQTGWGRFLLVGKRLKLRSERPEEPSPWSVQKNRPPGLWSVKNFPPHTYTPRQINSKIKSKTIHIVYVTCPTHYIFELICQNHHYKCQKLFIVCPLILTKSSREIWYNSL